LVSSAVTSRRGPRGKIPENKMVFEGIKNETEIANLWTYLSHFDVDGSSK
jgi:cytochrome c